MSLKAQVKKEWMISQLKKTRANILTEVAALSKADQDRVFLGSWSIKDLLAHLAGWDYTNMEAVKSVLAGKVPSFYEHHGRDWQSYNAMLVKRYRKNTFRELRVTVKASQKKLVDSLKAVSPEYFNKDFGIRFRGYKVTIQKLLEAEIKDEQVHSQQIVDFFGKAK